MTEPTIACPHCNGVIRLTESLAAPLIATTRREFERRLSVKDEDIAQRELGVRERERAIVESRRALDVQVAEQVAAQLKDERARVAAEEASKAKRQVMAEMEARVREVAELQVVLRTRERKLAEAQAAQADLIKRQRQLDDEKRELDLTVERRVQSGLGEAREKALRQAEDHLKQKVLEKDHTITSMQRTIDELKLKADRGSQQLQGEVQELELEAILRSKFSFDLIEPIPKGEIGGDVLQVVRSNSGQRSGMILWEMKRTRNWNEAWLAKLREDQRAAAAEVCVLVSHALPKGVDSFDMLDGVWVVHPRCIVPMASVLRSTLLQLSLARQTNEGLKSKADLIYQYLTGARFRHRLEAIVEAFNTMQEDLDKERRVITKQWAKREEQIERVMGGTLGMYGDLQGIAGKSLVEIEGLEWRALELDGQA